MSKNIVGKITTVEIQGNVQENTSITGNIKEDISLQGSIKKEASLQGQIQEDAAIQGHLNYSTYELNRDYNRLANKPSIEGATLIGDKSFEDIGIINDKNYLHIQNTASNIWEINHNLNKYPAVTVVDSAGNEVVGDIEYIDVNNLIMYFKGAFKGKATLN